jgi:membrane-associated protease RseP (regulator of RpoE activity)
LGIIISMSNLSRYKPLRIHITLFILTFISTLAAGSLQQGINPIEHPKLIWHGLPFSLTLLLILGAHEFGHYFVSRRHHIEVTLPYFIPAPSLVGTFGAFIKMKSPILDRRILLDVGAAGPLSGMIVAIPILLIGLYLSDIRPTAPDSGITLGSSILFYIFSWIIYGSLPDTTGLILHPMAFSGWIGLLVTAINLIPVGQLDGGHVAYAVLGRKQHILSKLMVLSMVIMGLTGWSGWLIWAALLMIMGLQHPPVVYDWIPLDEKRMVIGWITLTVFVLTFTPVPFG